MPSTSVILQQAVFGYQAGHNLIAASQPLSLESRRMLAMLTDASGPWPANGFEHGFTGTPLPDEPYYALFCTWPAREMPRPGCVWSHVLLIELADLASLTDLGELRRWFRRPKIGEEQSFSTPLHFSYGSNTKTRVAASRRTDALRFLDGLYLQVSTPFAAQTEETETFEDLVFAIWTQQWPRLRRNFRFSTASFGDRSRGGYPFDLQIMPVSSARLRPRSTEVSQHTACNSESSEPLVAKWQQTALNDLMHPEETGLRSFLGSFGVDIEKPRNAFVPLTTVYSTISNGSPSCLAHGIRLTGRLFPDPKEAVRLKQHLLSPQNSKEARSLEFASAVFDVIFAPGEGSPFAEVSLDFENIVKVLWLHKRNELLSLLAKVIRQPDNARAGRFIAAVAQVIDAADFPILSELTPELLLTILRQRPSLAFSAVTWQLTEHVQRRVFETLSEQPLRAEDWGNIMAAMFLSATPVGVREAVEQAREHAIEAAFQWLDQEIATRLLPSQIWREALAGCAAARLATDHGLPPSKFALCAWLASPRAVRKLLKPDRPDVKQLAEQKLESIPQPLRTHSAFLLVSLGLEAAGAESITLIIQGLFKVHHALATNKYSSESWSLISAELPRSPWWREWDRCEKLRRAVRVKIASASDQKKLIRAAASAEEEKIVRQICSDEPEEREFVD